MFLKGGTPVRIEGIVGIEGNSASVICPRCGTIWQTTSIIAVFSEEEQEKFWSGQGCPDCMGFSF